MSARGRGNVPRFLRRSLLVYMRPYWREQLFFCFTALVRVAQQTLMPLGVKVLIDQAIPQQDFPLLRSVLLGLLLLYLAAGLANWLQALIRALFGAELEKDLRIRLFARIQDLPLSFLDRMQPGEMTALFASEIVTLRDSMPGILPNGLQAVLGSAVLLITMLALNWKLSVLLMLLLPFKFRVQRRAMRRSEIADFEDNLADARVSFAVQESVNTQLLVRAYGLGRHMVKQFSRGPVARPGDRRTLANYDRAFLRKGLQNPTFLKLMVTISADLQQMATYVLILCLGSFLCLSERLSIGTFSALLSLVVSLGQAVTSTSAYFQEMISGCTALERFERILDVPATVQDRPGAVDLPEVRGQYRFDQVCFGYGERQHLSHLSFELPERGLVAFVGRSGCGKSSVLKLMLRFYDPTSGQILLDGRPLPDIRRDSLRGKLGVVLQELVLAHGSIRDNIALVKPDASDAEVEEAARQAHIHEIIRDLPHGYHTPVGEGGRFLSVGQRQRVALARALLARPSVLLLDEITSALDPHSEAAVEASLEELARDRLVVLMTHRLAPLVRADLVLVLQDGHLAQSGQHSELVEQPGPYQQLWRAQSGFVVSQDGRRAEVTAERLAEIPLFAEMSEKARADLAGRFYSEFYEVGQSICREGDPGHTFFLIARGRARVWSRRGEDEMTQVATLADGDFFGEDALLEGSTYSTGVEAEFPTLVLLLEREDFCRLVADTQEVREAVQDTALGRSLTLFGGRGRRPSTLSIWNELL
ncbi:ATP-binding cassette domain-containing protein [bacterium]|nr:ATP-binding cassette domain-containing protein [bacterium]